MSLVLRSEGEALVKILILKPSSLGDVIQALPVLRLLRRRLPQSEIYWWIESGLAPLLEHDPDLSGIIRFNRQGWARAAQLDAALAGYSLGSRPTI